MSSNGVPGISSQMIPTPGFTVSSNHSHMNIDIDSYTNGNVFSSAESTMVSQSQLQQQKHVGDQSPVLQNLDSQMSGGMRPGLLQKPFANSNSAINTGLGLIGNDNQVANESGTSEGHVSSYANSPNHLQQYFDRNQKPVVQGNLSAFSLFYEGRRPSLPHSKCVELYNLFSCIVCCIGL